MIQMGSMYPIGCLIELKTLPRDIRNFPGNRYITQIMSHKFDTSHRNNNDVKRNGGQATSTTVLFILVHLLHGQGEN